MEDNEAEIVVFYSEGKNKPMKAFNTYLVEQGLATFKSSFIPKSSFANDALEKSA